tara:strand:+ start:250 stop:420 length:171 start_codon:yes stop_codon:yes gene_type:complete
MADKEDKKVEAKAKELDYTVWHPDFLLNHIYELKDGTKIYWTLKSMESTPMLKYAD